MIMHDFILTFYFLMWFALVGLTIMFVISGLDDVLLDVLYWVRYVYRLRKIKAYPPLTYEQLLEKKEQKIAILLPCWRESNVIADMLKHNCSEIDYENYTIFVGVYPNDVDTVKEVQQVAHELAHVQCVVGEKPGPTNKASNLNQIYQAVKQAEETEDTCFDIILFHDSEDIIHPLSFKLYNYLIPRKDMIQLPVFPLETSFWNFTHWVYVDEFAENHTKNMVVREAMHLHVPSAGVGTAFSRHVLRALEQEEGAHPFSENSLTEDYRTSFVVRNLGFSQIFLTQTILRTKWVERGLFKKTHVQKVVKERIATRAMFPLTYYQSVRQKTRWIIGIIFQEWEHTVWPRSWRLRYSLAHDRKAFITHFINGFAYLVFFFWVIYGFFIIGHPTYPSLQEQFNLHPWVWMLLTLGIFIMMERFVQRFIATTSLYGVRAGMLSIPRVCYGNVLNLHAVVRAYLQYFVSVRSHKKKKPVVWDKTEHHFPGQHVLTPYRIRLGDLLVKDEIITASQLNSVVIEQGKTGERLGEILLRLGLVTKKQLVNCLSEQYNLEVVPKSQCLDKRMMLEQVLPKKNMKWLRDKNIHPVDLDVEKKHITLGLVDPTNERLIIQTMRYMKAYAITFLLVDEYQ